MRRRIAVVLLGVLLATACTDDGPDADQAHLVVEGSATVVPADGAERIVTDSATLAFGDTVAIDAGTGTLEFADGSVYELRAGGPGTMVQVGAPPVLLGGDLLVSDGFPASVSVDTATITALGALRVDAAAELAEAYTGRATVAGVGDLDEVLALRQVLLSPAATPEPLDYDGGDEWDRRYLGEAIAFGQRLEALARGYTNDLQPGGGRTVSFFEAVIPALDDEREFNTDLLDDRAPGETLVGAAIAVQGREGNFRDRWRAIFAFRDAGARWGLVALDQGVSSAPVLDTIEQAIGESPLSNEPRPSTTTSTSPSTTSTTTTTGTGPTSTSTTTTTTTTTVPPGDDGILGPILDPARDVLQELLESVGLG